MHRAEAVLRRVGDLDAVDDADHARDGRGDEVVTDRVEMAAIELEGRVFDAEAADRIGDVGIDLRQGDGDLADRVIRGRAQWVEIVDGAGAVERAVIDLQAGD